MAKHFVVNPSKENFDRAELVKSQLDEKLIHATVKSARDKANEAALAKKEALKYIEGRVVVKLDIEAKNTHRFEDGTVIRRERKYNQFNMRIAQPVNAIVISAEYIPCGTQILINHNAIHETNKIFDYPELTGKDAENDIRYYSLPEEDCYAWLDIDGSWKPLKNFEFSLRVFEPYKGSLLGIEPTLYVDTLYVTTGSLRGKVVGTLKFCDYEIVFQGLGGKEERVIRFRHSEDESFEREEVAFVNDFLTERMSNGELLVGFEPTDAKTITND
jgi:hypothetical protein